MTAITHVRITVSPREEGEGARFVSAPLACTLAYRGALRQANKPVPAVSPNNDNAFVAGLQVLVQLLPRRCGADAPRAM
jgi:hypothetical protein